LQVGAPLRPVTVRDAIGDLPPIENGHMEEEMEYVSGPVSERREKGRRGNADERAREHCDQLEHLAMHLTVPVPSSLLSCAPPQVSAFQQYVRGDCTLLTDHISKQMNELNLERCRWVLDWGWGLAGPLSEQGQEPIHQTWLLICVASGSCWRSLWPGC